MTNNLSQALTISDLGYELSVTDGIELAHLHEQLFTELTAKECDCIYWLALGLQAKKVASLIGISERMIRKRMISAADKLGVSTVSDVKFIYHRRVQQYYQKQTLETNRLLLQLLNQHSLS